MEKKVYGHFDDAQREYVITDPQTPWPWINYLGNEDFFSLISNTAGGYSFFKDATMECLWTMVVGTSISRMATLFGTQGGNLARHHSTAMNVVMA